MFFSIFYILLKVISQNYNLWSPYMKSLRCSFTFFMAPLHLRSAAIQQTITEMRRANGKKERDDYYEND